MRYPKIMAAIFSLLLVVSLGYAVDYTSLMQSGNTHYENSEFDQAALDYEKILAADGESSTVYYNLGCAYFNQKEYGQAILNFEKAKKLAPRDEDVQHNLEFSKLFLKDRFELPEPMPLVAWFTDLRQSLALRELRIVEIACFILLILSILIYRMLRNNPAGKSVLVLVYLLGLLFILSAGWLWERTLASEAKSVVLLVDEANISSAPIAGSSTLFVIHEGTSAEIIDATDAWYEIRLPDGKTGWIIHEAVGIY